MDHTTRNPNWPTISREARERSGGICAGADCGRWFPQAKLHVDHIVRPELCLLDPDAPSNLQVLCETCHGKKTAAEQPLYSGLLGSPLRAELARRHYSSQPSTDLKDTLVGTYLSTERDRSLKAMIAYGSRQRGTYRG